MSEKINNCTDKNCLSDDCLQCPKLTKKTKNELLQEICDHKFTRYLDCDDCKQKGIPCDVIICIECGMTIEPCKHLNLDPRSLEYNANPSEAEVIFQDYCQDCEQPIWKNYSVIYNARN